MYRLELQRDEHIIYLNEGLKQLGPSFVALDSRFARLLFLPSSFLSVFFLFIYFFKFDFAVQYCSRPWLCYWIIHSMALLGESLDYQLENNAIDFLNRCQVFFFKATSISSNLLLFFNVAHGCVFNNHFIVIFFLRLCIGVSSS
jgi:hypothetical protein